MSVESWRIIGTVDRSTGSGYNLLLAEVYLPECQGHHRLELEKGRASTWVDSTGFLSSYLSQKFCCLTGQNLTYSTSSLRLCQLFHSPYPPLVGPLSLAVGVAQLGIHHCLYCSASPVGAPCDPVHTDEDLSLWLFPSASHKHQNPTRSAAARRRLSPASVVLLQL